MPRGAVERAEDEHAASDALPVRGQAAVVAVAAPAPEAQLEAGRATVVAREREVPRDQGEEPPPTALEHAALDLHAPHLPAHVSELDGAGGLRVQPPPRLLVDDPNIL